MDLVAVEYAACGGISAPISSVWSIAVPLSFTSVLACVHNLPASVMYLRADGAV